MSGYPNQPHHTTNISTRSAIIMYAELAKRLNSIRGITMKNIFILLIIAGAGYQGWLKYSLYITKPEPLYDEPYVVVYGRNSCGHTQQTLKDLKKSGIPFEYKIVDDESVANQLHNRMQNSGIDTRRYNLPVVDVNNNFSIRPKSSAIIDSYSNLPI